MRELIVGSLLFASSAFGATAYDCTASSSKDGKIKASSNVRLSVQKAGPEVQSPLFYDGDNFAVIGIKDSNEPGYLDVVVSIIINGDVKPHIAAIPVAVAQFPIASRRLNLSLAPSLLAGSKTVSITCLAIK